MSVSRPASSEGALDRRGRLQIIIAVFLGWMAAGMVMALMVPATRPAIHDFLASGKFGAAAREFTRAQVETLADMWFSWYLIAFLMGAACGGLLFGWIADRWGRVRAMGWSILCFSGLTGLSYGASTPHELLWLRFLACLGIGGMWPSGVALASEAWPRASRPLLAGLIGASANVGFLILGLIMLRHPVTKDSWRWVLLLGSAPFLPALLVFRLIPESPRWIEHRRESCDSSSSCIAQVFHPPLLRLTLLGICLGTIPLLGGWASGQRLVPWAAQFAETAGMPNLRAWTQTAQAAGAVIGSLLGGWLACALGRRRSYFVISAVSLALSLGIFLALRPTHPWFLGAVFALGLVGTSFYGWLPYFIPELFPTRVRATGAGVAFNFGRVFSAAAILASGALTVLFGGDIGKMGAATSLVYSLGLVVVWFIPDPRAD